MFASPGDYVCKPLQLASDDCPECDAKAHAKGLQIENFGGMSNLNRAIARQGGLMKDVLWLCEAIKMGDFSDMIDAIENDYGSKLELIAEKIRCQDEVITSVVLNEPASRFFILRGMRRYFQTKINKPELFTRFLLYEESGRNTIYRIERALKSLRSDPETFDEEIERKLLYMHKRYTNFIKKYPINQ